MPILNVYMYEGRTIDQKRKLVTEVTDAVCRALDVGPEVVRIIINDMPRENMAAAGALSIDRGK
ncbi:MAG: 2-hydroxymuconate tautomerase family protein [Synergistaceae bacterium]|nr:2-hydroxymuconate tautomerase family protein [Synergistaceae bacterium]